MGDDRIFVDTNILVYAHDRTAGERHDRAKDLVRRLWDHVPRPSLSIQVLQELYVNLRRKGIAAMEARETVLDYLSWDVQQNDTELLQDAMQAADRWQLSFWDATVIAAARRARARVLWTEDLGDGQEYDGVRAVNPLKTPTTS
jgi:predicted nucleic acid-binding protein